MYSNAMFLGLVSSPPVAVVSCVKATFVVKSSPDVRRVPLYVGVFHLRLHGGCVT